MKRKLIYLSLILIFVGIAGYLLITNSQVQERLGLSPRPNILLITLDALRPDHLGCYGYQRNTSPNIDKLARGGVLFTQAIAQAPWTGASLASLLTSTHPSTHKIDKFGAVLDKRLVTLTEILKMKDYYTLATSGGDWIYKDFPGFERGFTSFIDAGVAQQTVEWLKKLQNKRFFIWLHFFDYPHAPYLPPPPYNKLFISHQRNRHVPIGKGLGMIGSIPDFVAINNITDVDYYISQYDGEIAYADEQIGKILDELKNLNLDKDTIVIISADHGESLGEHDYYFQHDHYLFDQLLKVPLIIRGPIIPKDKIINRQVRLIDIIPTILHILKIRCNRQIEGVSLLPLILGKDNYPQLYAFSELCEKKSIRTSEWKLICTRKEKYELYNLRKDPEELTNLVEIEKEQFKYLKAKLEEWMKRPRPNIISLTKPLDEQTKEKLKSLGYIQ